MAACGATAASADLPMGPIAALRLPPSVTLLPLANELIASWLLRMISYSETCTLAWKPNTKPQVQIVDGPLHPFYVRAPLTSIPHLSLITKPTLFMVWCFYPISTH